MMLNIDGRCLALLIGVVSVFLGVSASLEKSPKIITKEGNVIFEAGINKNITFQLNGRSRLVVNNFDVLELLTSGKGWTIEASSQSLINSIKFRRMQSDVDSLKVSIYGRIGVNNRLRRLENRTQSGNPTLAIRRTQRRITTLEGRVRNLITKLRFDNCKSNPCENGGSCIDLYDGFLCKCTKGFEGLKCSTDVNECALFAGTDIGCQNGAQCINQIGSYSCICNSGWQGVHCTQRKADCLHSSNLELCGHGTCVNTNDNFGYRCICEQGWTSNGLTPSCTLDVDECKDHTNPCATKCINLPGGFMCAQCDVGYTGNGLTCRDIDECSTGNGGCSTAPFVPCINTYGSYHCGECPVGWIGDGRLCTRNTGQSCTRNNICHPVALCQEVSNRIVCTCPVGLIGNGVGPNGCLSSGRNMCTSNPCLNGGSCMDTGNGSYTCLCPAGFRPPNCLRNVCAVNPCNNGGSCRQHGSAFTCICTPGFTGRVCNTQISRCGQYITGEQGNLKYPLNNMYSHNSQCSWVIRTNETKVLNVTFSKFEIEDSMECRFDWLQMHDGPTAAAQLIGRFCGSTPPLGGKIITTSNRLYLWFKSDNSTAKAGFELWWNSIEPVCGGIVEFDSHTTIASPGSPGNYPPSRDCKWHLKAPNNKRIKLVFFNLQIEKHTDCNHDFLEVLDAISATRLEIFCQSGSPSPFVVPSNEIILHFHSDNEGYDQGFQIHASTVERIPGCGGTYTDRSGEIISPTAFSTPMSCEYMVRYPSGLRVQLQVTDFQMGDDDCIQIYEVRSGTKEAVGRWCGKMNMPLFRSESNVVQIDFVSKGGTFKIAYGSICEYIFEESDGVITSPNYPGNYPASQTCIYEIIGDPNQLVSLEFVDIDLESNAPISTCWFDYITIADGMNATAAGPFCGSTVPPKIISSTNVLKIKLQTDQNNAGRGFKANYTLMTTGNTCGGIMRKSSGEISLPMNSELGVYQHDLSCTWTIIAPAGYGIQVSWVSFKLEESSACTYDYVELRENEKDSDGMKFCGSRAPPAFVTASNVLVMHFSSDSTDSEAGFVARYSFVALSSLCGGFIYSSNGRIQSPNWPSEYPHDLNCSWTISVKTGYQIELLVKSMDLEESKDCQNDWIEIRNGGSRSSPLIGKYCGKTIPSRLPSFTHQMHLDFRTNAQVAKSGFSIEWQTIAAGCGGLLSTDHGSVASPLYPEYYGNDAQCEWRISINRGSIISLKFVDLSLESLLSCTYDFVEIYDGPTASSRKIGRYCDMRSPILINTTGSDALIRFQSDSSNTDRGFYLTYESNCNHRQPIVAANGVIESPNFGDNNPNQVNCSWIITAPKGARIVLDFEVLGRKDNSQLMDIGNGTDTNPRGNKLLGVYFKEELNNNTIVPVLSARRVESQSNSVLVWLNTTTTYFRLEYAMKGCIKRFHKDTGEFESPGFPKEYPSDSGCVWQIVTDIGKAIELVIYNMDIQLFDNCTEDYLQVWNTEQKTHSLGKFCGKKDLITVTSSGHTMYIEFVSNLLFNGKGFTAKYKTVEAKCGGKFAMSQGTILSPNYPNNYASNLHCEWLLQVPEHSTMQLTIEELDIEDSYRCSMDAVKMYDGPIIDPENPWQMLCGDRMPDVNVFNTSSNTAMLVFDTDSDTETKGFKISFKENCGKRLVINDTGRIHFQRADRSDCMWVLVAEDITKHVTFTTTYVQITEMAALVFADDRKCGYLEIFDGDFKDTTGIRPKEAFCDQHPPATTSSGHALTIKLSGDYIERFDGYFTIMDNNCGGMLYSMRGRFASPSYPESYPVNVECIWNIVATKGNSLSLTIQQLDIDKTDGCNGDYLEVREGNSIGRLIGVFCGDDVPPTMTAQQAFWIKFNSDNDNVRKGFIAEYSYATLSELNGTEGIIESPLYPQLFMKSDLLKDSAAPHSWRITVPRGDLIFVAFEDFLGRYERFLNVYNGYDEQAEQIEITTDTNIIRSGTNNLYFTSSLGTFRLHWYKVSKSFMASNQTSVETSSNCSRVVTVGTSDITIQSPGYPYGYDSNVNCSWIIAPSEPESHAVVTFSRIDLEDEADCRADRVIVSSSTDLTTWKQLDKRCKLKAETVLELSGDRFLKVDFLSDYGVNKTGFSARASSACGSTINEASGVINATKFITELKTYQLNCIWKIQVKTGRRIKINFLESFISSRNDSTSTPNCRMYVLLKNGISEHSPNLGSGKYCDSNIQDVPVTSSNEVYIKLHYERLAFSNAKLSFSYEEVMNDCSHSIKLDESKPWVIINSENYPNIPQPHSRCVWNVRANVYQLLAVTFVDPIDLKESSLCDSEYIELHDGSTDLSPLIGRFCGKSIPSTQFTTGNNLRVTFFTDIAEPHIGFRANISLGVCGGTYRQLTGSISAPISLPAWMQNSSCDYLISVPMGRTINLTLHTASLPWGDNCTTVNHLVLTELSPEEGVKSEPKIICGGITGPIVYLLDTNRVQIKFRVLNTNFERDAFKLSYSAVGHQCGQTIEAESGILKSPAYIAAIQFPSRCMWKLIVPKGRRIKIEFLEFNAVDQPVNVTERLGYRYGFRIPGRLVLANDFEIRSIIARIARNPPAVLYSTDNIMGIMSLEIPSTQRQGFKLRFSSDEGSLLCNENFERVQGEVHFSQPQNASGYCRYKIGVRQNKTFALTVERMQASSDIFSSFMMCLRHGPLSVRGVAGEFRLMWFCENRNETTIRVPFPLMLDIMSNPLNNLTSLDMKFARHNCGGVFTIGSEFTLTQPSTLTPNYGAMDCAWRIQPQPGGLDQFEVSLSVDFKLKCDEQYLIVHADATMTSPHLGRFCNQATANNLLSTKNLFIEYHTSNYELASTFNLTARIGTGCGGEISYPFRSIDFRKQYVNNVECIWTIRADRGYHIGLSFSNRFFIESSDNCSKDYILVQEQDGQSNTTWKDLKRFCGREPPSSVNTTTSAMRFIFRSDDSGTGDGFTASFERNCGGVLAADTATQSLSSPNYPSNYGFNLTCNYTILPGDSNRNLLVQIKDFLLEDSPTGKCDYDNLTVSVVSEEPVVLCGSNNEKEFRSTKPITVLFRTDGSYSRRGFLLEYGEEKCGGVITSSTTITSPRQQSDNMYPPSTTCFWNITAPEGSKIVIKFEEFDFEGSMACNYDHVQVFSGKVPVDDQRLAKLCGNLTGQLPPFSIPSNVGIIQSTSDPSQHSLGFSALIKIMKNCDKAVNLTGDKPRYTLDDFAKDYENNLDCGYSFKADRGQQIVLEFSQFHIEDSQNCESDYVQLFDSAGPFGDEIGKFCGHEIPNSLMSSRSSMFLRFVSDSSGTSSGFSAVVKTLPLVCGQHEMFVNTNETVVVTSGTSGNYLPNLNCFWRLRSDNNIRLDFEKFDLQAPDANGTCTADFVKVFNKEPYQVIENGLGSDIIFTDASNNYNAAVEHVFCGQGAPEGYYTNSQDVFVKFSTDSTIEKTGFKIVASSAKGCFKNFTTTQGRILMETQADCTVYINAPQNYSLSLYVNYFSFGIVEACLEVFDEKVKPGSDQRISKLCGSLDGSNSIFSNSNKLRLLISNTHIFNSFDITFLASDQGPGCGGDLYNYAGIFTSPFYPQNLRNNSDCRWNIRVPNNMVVSLEFRIFDLGSKVTCRSDYLQILEQESTSGGIGDEVVRQFCGEDNPTIYTGRRNTLAVRFRKTVNFDGTGWVIRFSGVRARQSLL